MQQYCGSEEKLNTAPRSALQQNKARIGVTDCTTLRTGKKCRGQYGAMLQPVVAVVVLVNFNKSRARAQ